MVGLWGASGSRFLGCGWFEFWATPNLLMGGFVHQHNNRQRVEQARKSTGKIRQTGVSKKLLFGEEMVELPCDNICIFNRWY